MITHLRIAMAQLNPKVGAIAQNLEKAKQTILQAENASVDILLFTELFLTGYMPEDLLFRRQFIQQAMAAAHDLAHFTRDKNVSVLLPTLWQVEDRLYNAVLLLQDGAINDRRYKVELPNDDVFYERRYFTAGQVPDPIEIHGIKIGVPICEDLWHERVVEHLKSQGAELILCPNGSPYWKDKQTTRRALVAQRNAEVNLPILYANQVGGQDELVFDGASFAVDAKGALVAQGKSFAEDFIITDWERGDVVWRTTASTIQPLPSIYEAPYQAAMLGLRDYVHKNGFKSVVLGLSGGIDSALVAAIAVDALGADCVHTIMLPYHYTTDVSLKDAQDCANNLGVKYDIVSIANPVEAVNAQLASVFADKPADITEENIQSRMRGVVLMAVSNKLGSLLLTTGNKSEMAVGYATLYGDMNGAYNPLKDMLKMQVYALSEWRNNHLPLNAKGPDGEAIPHNIISKAPSAELRPDQTDQDSLPPYPVLDAIIEGLVENDLSLAQLVEKGFDPTLIKRIEHLIAISEFKRRQSAPGPKLTAKAFGSGRRYPITSGYRDGSISQ